MKLPPRQRFALLVLLATLLLATACRSNNPPSTSSNPSPARTRVLGQRGGSLSYRVSAPPQTFNYLLAADESSLLVAFYLLGGRLLVFDHDTQSYQPGLAEAWQLSNDGRSVEMTLRADGKFSDGQRVTAEDVVFTLRALYDERTAAPLFRDAMLINGRQIEATAIDARRLRLTFPEVIAAPEGYLSNLAVLPRHVLETDFNQGKLREAYVLTAELSRVITAGAFAPQAITPGERITLRRNPHYWQRDSAGTPLPYLDELTIEVISDANNALARLRQGALDIFDRIRPNDYAALRGQGSQVQVVDLGPGLSTDHLWFNLNAGVGSGKPIVNPVKRAWFDDVRFRRAVAHAIDRETIAKVTLQSLATPLYGFISPGNRAWRAEDLPRTVYDLEKARALLREAGFVARGTPESPELYDAKGNRVELTLIVPVESQARVQMATVVQEDLAKLGIKLQVAPVEFGELSRRIAQSCDYEAALLGASPSEPDPSAYVNFLRSNSPAHQWHPKQTKPATAWEARIDELLAAQARAINPEQRRAHFREIQNILAEQLPVIPLVARHAVSAANQRVGNYRPSALLPYSLWNAEELFVRYNKQ